MEFKYLFKNKLLLLILLLMAGNMLLYYKNIIDSESIFYDENGFSYSEYVKYYNGCIDHVNKAGAAGAGSSEELTGRAREYYKENINDGNREVVRAAVKAVNSRISYITGYKSRIEETVKRAEIQAQSSLYSNKASFGYNNILKGRYDIKKLKDIKPELFSELAADSILGYRYSIWFAAAIMIMLAGKFRYDKKGLALIVRSSKHGRVHLALKRCAVIAAVSFGVSLMMQFPVILTGFLRYGGTDCLNILIQSDESFAFTVHIMTFSRLFAAELFLNTIACIFMAMLAWLFFSVFRERAVAIAGMAAFFLAEAVLYLISFNNMLFRFLKYINVFNFMNLPDRIRYYENWGFGTNIITVFTLSLAGILILTAVTACTDIAVNSGIWGGIQVNIPPLGRLVAAIRKKTAFLPCWIKELKKILFIQKAGVLIIAVIVLASVYKFGVAGTIDEEALNLQSYYKYVQGDAFDKTDEYIKNIEYQLENARKSLEEAEEKNDLMQKQDLQSFITEKEKLLDNVVKQSDRARSLVHKGVEGVRIVDFAKLEKKYGARTDIYSMNLAAAVIMLIVLAFGRTFMIERSNNTDVIIRSGKKGGSSFLARKIAYSLLMVELVVVAAFVIRFVNINRAYPLTDYEWSAAIQSIPAFEASSLNISFLGMEILSLIVRMAIFGLITVMIVSLSLIYDDGAVYLISFIAMIPYLLECVGITMLQHLSVIRISAGYSGFITDIGTDILVIFIFCLLLLTVIAAGKGIRKWKMY